MQFDPNNVVIQLCVKGMESETKQNPSEAKSLFLQAWGIAESDFEKFTASHYVARHQNSTEEKLKWDEKALAFALNINDPTMNIHLPSLYLNIAKCFEDLRDIDQSKKNYDLALSFSDHLPDTGYGKMIKAGIENGIKRLSKL